MECIIRGPWNNDSMMSAIGFHFGLEQTVTDRNVWATECLDPCDAESRWNACSQTAVTTAKAMLKNNVSDRVAAIGMHGVAVAEFLR